MMSSRHVLMLVCAASVIAWLISSAGMGQPFVRELSTALRSTWRGIGLWINKLPRDAERRCFTNDMPRWAFPANWCPRVPKSNLCLALHAYAPEHVD